MRWVMILWWLASKKATTAEIFSGERSFTKEIKSSFAKRPLISNARLADRG